MVSDIAGTTRDAIDTRFTAPDGNDYVLIDTAGIRRKRAIEYQSLERFSIVRALAAIDRCDVALMVIDATQGVTEQDSKIAGYIDEQGKAAIIVINKWDAIEKDTGTMNEYVAKVREGLKILLQAVNTGVLDATNGLLDVQTVAGLGLTIAALRSKAQYGWTAPGAVTLLWWASKFFGVPRE